MDKNKLIKIAQPHFLSILLFLVVTSIYFSPFFEGKVINQGDILQSNGMAQEVRDYYKKTGIKPFWTNSMFGGMPNYLIAPPAPKSLVRHVDSQLKHILPKQASVVALCLIGYYILLLSLGVSPWLSAVGALAFGFSTYNFLVIEAGHNSKINAIYSMAPVVAGVLLTFQKRWLIGGALFSLALALNVNSNHYQITYYLLLMLLIYGIVAFIDAIKNNQLPHFLKASGILVAGGILAILTNIAPLYNTYSYSKETIRGKSELTGTDKSGSGLDKEYALAWSYGKLETFTLLVPQFMGGGSGEKISKDSKTYKLIKQKNGPMYWGAQPFTGGTIYFGAIIVFLFVLGCIIVPGHLKWWLVSATILSILLAWGKNLEWFTDIFFYYFPLYNKFRVVSMILVLAQFTMPLLGILAVHEIIKNNINKDKALKALYISGGIVGGLLLLFILLGGSLFDFSGLNDGRYPAQLVNALEADRASMLRMDSLRSLGLVVIAFGLLWAFIQNKIKELILVAALGVFVLGDLWMVNRRYLDREDFVTERKFKKPLTPSKADQAILADTDPHYRVLNLAVNTFNDATTSYNHKSIGGYHGAKLRRYQDLIDRHLQKEIQAIGKGLQNQSNTPAQVLAQQKVLNMLNMKYVIYNPEAAPLQNPNAFSNAWFVDNYKIVANADEEIQMLGTIDPKATAIIDQRYAATVSGKTFSKDATGNISLTQYTPDHLSYKSKANSEQLSVFSEIYYNSGKGWQAYIDGEKVDHIRVNYILRGIVVPSGEHTIDFKFEPKAWNMTNMIGLISSLLLLGGFIGIVGWKSKKWMGN